MKREIGDVVRVRKDLLPGILYGGEYPPLAIDWYKGKLAVIEDINRGAYNLNIDVGFCEWTDEMLED